MLETKFARIDADTVTEEGKIGGYASVFSIKDDVGDVVVKGAFAESLASGRPVRLLADHDVEKRVGTITNIFEDAKGLYIEGQILMKTQRGRDTYEEVKAGMLDSFSIGYVVVESSDGDDARFLEKIELFEVSLVNMPANPKTVVEYVKSTGCTDWIQSPVESKRYLEDVLKKHTRSNSKEAKRLVSLAAERDAGEEGEERDADSEIAKHIRSKTWG
ncbi:MAG: HK97 family phage prohead protease [Pseudomonadota bacterium]